MAAVRSAIAVFLLFASLFAGTCEAQGQSLSTRSAKAVAQVNAPANLDFRPDIVYSKPADTPLMLDLFLPKNGMGPYATVIILHGTGVSKGRPGIRPYAQALAECGFAALAVGFRYESKHPFPAALDDVNAALDWIHANAKAHNLDRKRIGVLGFSGGGSLATLLSAKKPRRIQAVVTYNSPSDLALLHQKSAGLAVFFVRPMLERWLGGTPDKVQAKYDEASPITYVHKDMAPHLLISGTADDIVPEEQSRILARKMKRAGAKVNLLSFENASHNFDEEDGLNARLAFSATERFLAEHLMHSGITLARNGPRASDAILAKHSGRGLSR